MLKHAPILAIADVDTAENGLSKVRQGTKKIRRNRGGNRGARSAYAAEQEEARAAAAMGKLRRVTSADP